MKLSHWTLSILTLICTVALLLPSTALAQDAGNSTRTALMYLPNRVLDLFDVVRATVKIGQGIAVGARFTRDAEAFVGTYSSLYIGLPGPRGRPDPRWPIGLQNREEKPGMENIGKNIPRKHEPHYGRGEIGFDLFPFVAGAGVGIDPFEIYDFFAGFLLFDPAEDDL